MDFQKIQDLVFETYKKDGYFDTWEKIEKILEPHGYAGIAQLAEVGLFHTEVAESQEEVRNMSKGKLRKELADIMIRIMCFASRKGIDLEKEILQVNGKNMKREHLHGRKLL